MASSLARFLMVPSAQSAVKITIACVSDSGFQARGVVKRQRGFRVKWGFSSTFSKANAPHYKVVSEAMIFAASLIPAEFILRSRELPNTPLFTKYV